MDPLLLLSGLLCDDTVWEDVAARLAPRAGRSHRQLP